MSTPPSKLDRLDGWLMVLLLGFIGLYTLRVFDFSAIPVEDAAILMRFADHMARGEGIVWNVGEPPVDGATDFLFLVTLGVLGMAGLSIETTVHLVGLLSHGLTCLLLYAAVRRLHGAPRWMAGLSAAYLAMGPGLRHVEAYFGSPYFALFGATTFYLAYTVFLGMDTRRTPVLFALSSLLLGLIRPEGVLLSAFILGGLLVTVGWRACRRLVAHYALVFGGLGAAYFFWRWHYFGYPLPNPFYVKGGGSLYPYALLESIRNVAMLSGPFLPVLLFAGLVSVVRGLVADRLRYRAVLFGGAVVALGVAAALYLESRGGGQDPSVHPGILVCLAVGVGLLVGSPILARLLPLPGVGAAGSEPPLHPRELTEPLFVLFPFLSFTFVWVLLSAKMNFLMRFQYALAPLVLMSWPPLLRALLRWWRLLDTGPLDATARSLRILLVLTFCAGALGFQHSRYGSLRHHHVGTYEVSRILADFDSGHTIALTNAGHLPYYSRWRAVDAWGLTDQWVAHHGPITAEYLARHDPAVIQFDAPYSPVVDQELEWAKDAGWYVAVRVLHEYAREGGYVLAAAYGVSPYKTHYYWVRSDLPERDEIVRRIRGLQYRWFADPHQPGAGEVCFDYASLKR